MANTVQVTVVVKNGLNFITCPQTMHLPCPAGTIIDGKKWYINSNDLQTEWTVPNTVASTTNPSFEVAHVTIGTNDLFIVGTVTPGTALNQTLADLCSTCCGTTEPVLAYLAANIPTLAPVSGGISTQDCNTGICTYEYLDKLPSNASLKSYTVTFICGATTVGTSTTVTTIAAALAYAVANWASYGTWALVGDTLTLTGSACVSGAVYHTLQNHSYCVTFVNGNAFNQINHNGTVVSIGQTVTYTTVGGITPVRTIVDDFFLDGTLSTFDVNQMGYVGTGNPVSFLLNGVVVASWGAGACS